MTLQTMSKDICIAQILQQAVTMPQREALNHIAKFVHNAKNSAFARPPQPTFTYSQPLSSALAEKLTPLQLKKLDEVGIKVIKEKGMLAHRVHMTFQS